MTDTDRMAAAVAHEHEPDPAVVERAVRAIYDVRRARKGLEPLDDVTWGVSRADRLTREETHAALAAAGQSDETAALRAKVEQLRTERDGMRRAAAAVSQAYQRRGAALARVEAYMERVESAGRVYGYGVAHDLRAALSGSTAPQGESCRCLPFEVAVGDHTCRPAPTPPSADRDALREWVLSVIERLRQDDTYSDEAALDDLLAALPDATVRPSVTGEVVATAEELDALPVGSVVLDGYAAVCTRVTTGLASSGWRRVTAAVKGGEHRHGPYLPADVLYRPEVSRG